MKEHQTPPPPPPPPESFQGVLRRALDIRHKGLRACDVCAHTYYFAPPPKKKKILDPPL